MRAAINVAFRCWFFSHDSSQTSGGITVRWAGQTLRVAAAFASAVTWMQQAMCADDQGFHPITTNLRGASPRRDIVDIEIIGSTSLVPHEHRLEPDRRLRFRLERAFITNFLTKDAPGFSILALNINRPTGLPSILLAVVSDRGRFQQDIPGVPLLAPAEQGRQHVRITIQSDYSDRSFAGYYMGANKCVTEPVGDNLWAIAQEATIGTTACSRSVYPDGSNWLARLSDGSPIVIACDGRNENEGSCSTRFAFEKFSVRIDFHRSSLRQWRDVIAFGHAFLASKQIAQ